MMIIMRGASGSGKSTCAKAIGEKLIAGKGLPGLGVDGHMNAVIVSADAFFTREGGEYVFNKDMLSLAHEQCLRMALLSMTNSYIHSTAVAVIVDNTNTTYEEVLVYSRVARALKKKVYIIDVESDYEKCVEMNVHGVPPETIIRQISNLKKSRARITSLGEVVSSLDLHLSE